MRTAAIRNLERVDVECGAQKRARMKYNCAACCGLYFIKRRRRKLIGYVFFRRAVITTYVSLQNVLNVELYDDDKGFVPKALRL
mgnify:CR=1 FL=1